MTGAGIRLSFGKNNNFKNSSRVSKIEEVEFWFILMV